MPLGTLPQLLRWRLSSLNGGAALAGYLLFPAPPDAPSALVVTLGVGLLAAAGSAFNQVQERDLDANMQRTCERPLPRGRLTPGAALTLAGGFALAGLLLLGRAGGWPAGLGLGALLWYNGVYTPLKRHSAFALAPGALCGALPPLIGWTAAGGGPTDGPILLLCGLLLLWQVPHFWLLLHRYRDDYRAAGLPNAVDRFGEAALLRLCRLWCASLGAASLLLPAFGLVAPLPALLLVASLPLLLLRPTAQPFGNLFARLNLFLGLVVATLLLQHL